MDAGRTSRVIFRAIATVPGRMPVAAPAVSAAKLFDLHPAVVGSAAERLETLRWRGGVDAAALRVRLSDPQIYARYRPNSEPARTLYELLEQNRVESLGAKLYAGVRRNLATLAEDRWSRARPEAVIRDSAWAWTETFALLTRVPLGAPMPGMPASAGWRSWLTAEEVGCVERLIQALDDQDRFAIRTLRVIEVLLGARDAEPAGRLSVQASKTARAVDGVDPNARLDGESGSQQVVELGFDAETSDAAPVVATGVATAMCAESAYAPYTTAFDEVVEASELFDAATLAKRRGELDAQLERRGSPIHRWAQRLRRRLRSRLMRAWQFDSEEGELDTSRLTRVLTRPLEPLAYKREWHVEFPEAMVTLLIDNSGSMRGNPGTTAALCAELLGSVLERSGIKSEVLGFTTRTWNGGRARQQWIRAKCPGQPGRLAELRHVIYKSADVSWRRARGCIGALLEEHFLKENVDGEALLWAYSRLLCRPEPRKVLVVISDGAPLDVATLEANGPEYLDRHLRAVVRAIESARKVELCAIGIAHNVREYYRRAVMVRDADALGEALVSQLIDLLCAPPASARASQAAGGRP